MIKTKRSLFILDRLKQQIGKWLFIYKYLGQVQPSVKVECPENIILGEDAKIGEGVRLYATPDSKIIIGRESAIGTDSIIYAFSVGKQSKDVIIGERCVIGAKSVILQGVTIGDDSVIGAGAVVTENTKIGRNELWVGVPAKFKKVRNNIRMSTVEKKVRFDYDSYAAKNISSQDRKIQEWNYLTFVDMIKEKLNKEKIESIAEVGGADGYGLSIMTKN
ncbi:MAG: DapH/DapD/GlmU-related protein [Candidatus Anstonellales archaeon]